MSSIAQLCATTADTQTMQNFATDNPDTRAHIISLMNLDSEKRMAMRGQKFMAIVDNGNEQPSAFAFPDCRSAVRKLMISEQPMFLIYMLAPLHACIYKITVDADGLPDFNSDTPLPLTQQALGNAACLFSW